VRFSWLITLLASLFFAIGVFGIGLAYFCDSYDDWASNIAVEGISLGLTVGVVDWIVRRSERDRLKPRIELAVGNLRFELFRFAQGATVDYAGTHLHTLRPIPEDVLASVLVELAGFQIGWLSGFGHALRVGHQRLGQRSGMSPERLMRHVTRSGDHRFYADRAVDA
jgi:hypothetical protein